MSKRQLNNTKWLWCLLVLWKPASSVSAKPPPNSPATVEAQAKFFQDFFSVQLSPYKIEFGHVCEDPNTWEQRYEKKDFKNHRDMGKVRWGDKHGGYGEHYWDLNHAGHAGDHGNDDYGNDGSYDHHNDGENNDPYDEPSEQSSVFGDDYNPEQSASTSFEENNRAKRAYPRYRAEKKDEDDEDTPLKITVEDESEENEEEEEEVTTRAPRPRKLVKQKRQKPREQNHGEGQQATKTETETKQFEPRHNSELNQYSNFDQQEPKAKKTKQFEPRRQSEQTQSQFNYEQPQQAQYVYEQPDPLQKPVAKVPSHYVPYEAGAGVRQYHAPDVFPATTAPRLFLDPSTGHVVDRATGQAYVLQPILANFN